MGSQPASSQPAGQKAQNGPSEVHISAKRYAQRPPGYQ